MARRLLTGFGIVAALLVVSHTAHAQFNQYNFPIERGIVENHLELQFQYSCSNPFNGRPSCQDTGLISAELALAFGGFEVSLNVPFSSGWVTDVIDGKADWQLGDILLGAKYKILGFGKNLGLAVYGNFWLPTHSGGGTHEYFEMAVGAAASVSLMGFEFGGGAQVRGLVIGGNFPDYWTMGLYGYGRLPLFGLIAINVALEYYNSFYIDSPSIGNGDINSFTLTPGIEVGISKIYGSVGTRVALTDDAKLINYGRIALLMNAGVRW